ncbi:hypothetical protein MTO96_012654 [Rhipicephalus appendiculatus]
MLGSNKAPDRERRLAAACYVPLLPNGDSALHDVTLRGFLRARSALLSLSSMWVQDAIPVGGMLGMHVYDAFRWRLAAGSISSLLHLFSLSIGRRLRLYRMLEWCVHADLYDMQTMVDARDARS